MARPLGPIAQAALQALEGGPLAVRDLCAQLQVPERRMKNICHRLIRRERIIVARRERRQGARRPLCLYTLADRRGTYVDLLGVWR